MRNMHTNHAFVEPLTGATIKKLSPAGAWLVRHRRVPRDIADTLAELAGFKSEVRRDG